MIDEPASAAQLDISGPYRPALTGLEQDLVRVDLEIRAWRAHATLTTTDLGLDKAKDYDHTLQEYLRLGRKRLLPTRYAQERERIERCARDDAPTLELRNGVGLPRAQSPVACAA